jgi:hypothetical protein
VDHERADDLFQGSEPEQRKPDARGQHGGDQQGVTPLFHHRAIDPMDAERVAHAAKCRMPGAAFPRRHERTPDRAYAWFPMTPGRGVLHHVRMLQVSGRAPRTVAVAALALALSGCGDGSGSTSYGDAVQNARVVLQADLRPGATGKTAARLAQKFIELDGVAGTHGDAGQHVWVYSTPDATNAEVTAALAAMHAEPSVARVERVD